MSTVVSTFRAWPLEEARVAIDVPTSPAGPLHLQSWRGEHRLPLAGSAVVLPTRPTLIVWPGRDDGGLVQSTLTEGCYALVPGGSHLIGGSGLAIYTPLYNGLAQVGGPVERSGRLNYIDGCSDTLLVCPSRKGEPCLNLLHLPPHIHQTAHTHPSDRIGIILRGAGVCITPDGEQLLRPGMFWYIPTDCVHSFHTADEFLDVFAWHPDSDFGPSHDFHPMLNRTIVDGVSANDPRHQDIRTV